MSTTVTLTLTLDPRTVNLLGGSSAPNFYADQADRFEILSGEDAPQPDDAVFAGGKMTWCATGADALLLHAYEQASGFRVTLLWDLVKSEIVLPAGGYADGYVVLSSRKY
jgi:hypothetical protein